MTYKTISHDQTEILKAIDALYLDGQGIYCDPMYGKGSFYKDFPQPRVCSDLKNGVDFRYTDFSDECMPSIILDPPFMHAQGKDSELKRYSSYPSQKVLHMLYRELIAEAHRVLTPGGILIFKCQDTVESGKQVMSHIVVYDLAKALGFIVEDLFIQIARSRMVGHNHRRQVHARKYHCFWWVFRKKVQTRALVQRGKHQVHKNTASVSCMRLDQSEEILSGECR